MPKRTYRLKALPTNKNKPIKNAHTSRASKTQENAITEQ